MLKEVDHHRGLNGVAICILLLATVFSPLTYSQEGIALEEIIVSAQKRSQNVQDIGIAISAFSGDTLRKMGVDSITQVHKFIPNVDMYDSFGSGQPVWVIRGVGLIDFNANNTPAASVYVDEIYQPSVAMGTLGLYDIDRVEVLKGPQGGLYGRNTSGGAVQVISRRPELGGGSSGVANLSYGKWGRFAADLAYGAELGDSAAFRLAGRFIKSNDTYMNSVSAGTGHGEEDIWSLRGQILLQAADNVEVLVKAETGQDKSETVLGRSIGVWDPQAAAGPFAQLFFGAPLAGIPNALLNLFAGDSGPYLCPPLINGRRDSSSCLSENGIAPDTVQGSNKYATDSDPVNRLDNESNSVSGIVTADFQNLVLMSITGYTDFRYRQVFDWDGGAGVYGHSDIDSKIKSWSQEFRLSGDAKDNLSWISGVAYSVDKFNEDREYFQTDNPSPLAPVWNLDYEQKTKSLAVFGQAEWRFTDDWNLVTGLRYTDESKEFRSARPSPDTDYFLDGGFDEKYEFDNLSGKAALEWTPTDTSLVYFSLSRGFKAGGYFGGFIFNFGPNTDSLTPYDKETVWAYELGFKSSWRDSSLQFNGAVFYYDYQDYQGFSTQATGGAVLASPLDNVGDVEIKGAEIGLNWLVAEGLRVQLDLGYLDGKISDSDKFTADIFTGLTPIPLEGQRLPFFSDWSGNALLRYERPLTSRGWLGAVQVDYSYRSEFTTAAAVTTAAERAIFEADGYGLVNLRMAVSSPDLGWEAAFAIRNLADKEYILITNFDGAGGFFDMYGPPRTWALEFNYNW